MQDTFSAVVFDRGELDLGISHPLRLLNLKRTVSITYINFNTFGATDNWDLEKMDQLFLHDPKLKVLSFN